MTQTARVITIASASTAIALGRSAEQWRNDFAISHFGSDDVDFSALTSNKKAPKPRFEVHERETARRTYRLTLMERSNANKLSEVSSVDVGMFGKLIKPAEEAPQEAAE